MGYELFIRGGAPGTPLGEEALRARLDQAQASGVPLPAPDPADQAPAPPAAEPGLPGAGEGQAAPTASGESAGTGAGAGAAGAAGAAAAAGSGGAGAPAGEGPWNIANGKGQLAVRLYRVDGAVRGADLDVPFGGTEEELRRAFLFATSVARSCSGTLFDPQLGREVGPGAADEVAARWRQSQAWMVDVAGTYDDSRALADLPSPTSLVSRRARIVLVLAGGFLLLCWLLGAVASWLQPPASP